MKGCKHVIDSGQAVLERFRTALASANYWMILTDRPWAAASLGLMVGLVRSASLDPDIVFLRVNIRILDHAEQVYLTGLALSKKNMRPHDAAVIIAGVSGRHPDYVLEQIRQGKDMFTISEDPKRLDILIRSIQGELLFNGSPAAN